MNNKNLKESLSVGDFLSSPTGKIFKIIDLNDNFATVSNCREVRESLWDISEDLEVRTLESKCLYSEMNRLEYKHIPSGDLWEHFPTLRGVFDEKRASKLSDIVDWREFDIKPECRYPKVRDINFLISLFLKEIEGERLKLTEKYVSKVMQRDELLRAKMKIEKALNFISLS